jgi:hypothetical protein
MKTGQPIVDTNLSWAWAKAFLQVMDASGGQLHPCLVTVENFGDGKDLEDITVRKLLDTELKRRSETSCASVSGTIFPISMWNPSLRNDAHSLFDRYNKAWLGIRKCPANRNGVYFRRLTAFDPYEKGNEPVNQLKFIIETYKSGNHRKSALQAAVFDPRKDHTNSRQKGFPCLQQVAFTPLPGNGMSVTGFYATQYQFEKAYGNYLGLYYLGRFMAKHLELKLTQVICIANLLKLGDAGKTELEGIANQLRWQAQKRGI